MSTVPEEEEPYRITFAALPTPPGVVLRTPEDEQRIARRKALREKVALVAFNGAILGVTALAVPTMAPLCAIAAGVAVFAGAVAGADVLGRRRQARLKVRAAEQQKREKEKRAAEKKRDAEKLKAKVARQAARAERRAERKAAREAQAERDVLGDAEDLIKWRRSLCGHMMPRAKRRCLLPQGHAGHHVSTLAGR